MDVDICMVVLELANEDVADEDIWMSVLREG